MIFIFIALSRPVSDKFGINLPSTWHGFPAKAFQVAFPASHLARFPRESVPGVFPRRPPGTVSLQKRSRCHFLPPTWHGIPAKVFQVSFPASHLARNSRESVPGVSSPPSTCHGISAKAFQVSLPASHLARNPRKSVAGVFLCLPPGTESPRKRSRCLSLPSTCHGIPAKACQVSFPCCPPGTESPQKRSRCHFLPSTWHGISAKAFQVSLSASHLARNSRESVAGSTSYRPPATAVPLIMGCRGFSAGQISSL